MGLYDGILIKDNHLASLGADPEIITTILKTIRSQVGAGVSIEIEVDSLEQVERALSGKPNLLLLDNMPLDQMREAVRRRNAAAPDVQLEASGGVNLGTVRSIAETGVDRISIGALTHSAPALDIALDYQGAE
jgi:nicotinate-nucleotide pyrophosphorylase (carboxylating)